MNNRRLGDSREQSQPSVSLSTPNIGQPVIGRLRSPIVNPQQWCEPKECVDYLCEIGKVAGQSGVLNWTYSPELGDQDFLVTGSQDIPGTGYPGTNAVVVASFKVSEGYMGLLEFVGLATVPATSYQSIVWQLRVSGQAVPKWSQNPIPGEHLTFPIPFHAVVPVGKTLQLVAINTTVNQVSAAGILKGFMRPTSTKKVGGL